MIETFTAFPETVGKKLWEWLDAHPNAEVKDVKRKTGPKVRGKNTTKVTLEYEENVDWEGILHMKAYKNLDELNKYLKAVHPNLTAKRHYKGIVFYLFEETPLLGIYPPDINHIEGWWPSSSVDRNFIKDRTTLMILITVLGVAQDLIDKFDDFGVDDFGITEEK